jgi:uncharacterized protein YcbK (DUF882 family)
LLKGKPVHGSARKAVRRRYGAAILQAPLPPPVWLPGRNDLRVSQFPARAARRALASIALLGAAGSLAGAARPPRDAFVPTPADTLERIDTFVGVAMPSDRGRGLAGGDELVSALIGRSGKLRAHFLVRDESPRVPGLAELLGAPAPRAAGMRLVDLNGAAGPFALVTMRPFADKIRGRIGAYRMGYWPFERRRAYLPNYGSPSGFIEVTPGNQDTYVSEHFRLRDFLTHDQQNVWPKYLVLDTRLVDKLELVIGELERDGIRVRHLAVMSGFRTPRYNLLGVGRGGRAATSRHQYGDAADVFVDNNEDGWTDDVNGDRRVNVRDAQAVQRAVERVEAVHPDLVGGVGVYPATRAHGPFTHVDARGHRAQWGKE